MKKESEIDKLKKLPSNSRLSIIISKTINNIVRRKRKLIGFRLRLIELFILTITAELFIFTFINSIEIFYSVWLIVIGIFFLLIGIFREGKKITEKELVKTLKEPLNKIDTGLDNWDYTSLILYTLSLTYFLIGIVPAASAFYLSFVGPEFVCPDFKQNNATLAVSYVNYRNVPVVMVFEWKGNNIQGYSDAYNIEKKSGFQDKFRPSYLYMPRSQQKNENEYTTFNIVMRIKDSNQTYANFSLTQPIENNLIGVMSLDLGIGGKYNCICKNTGNGDFSCEKF